MIVVTGATGHLGNNLVRILLAEGRGPVRAMVHREGNSEPLADLEVERVTADLLDPSSLAAAFAGADLVVHAAGMISIASIGSRRLRRVNVEGTRNVVAACRTCGVRRLVYTSSVHAFVEPPPGSCTSETGPIDPTRSVGPYARTKAEATLAVLQAADEGLETVVVYPSAIVGPYDHRPSHIGQLVLDFFRGRLWAYVDGAYDFVDVRDVARGIIAAADHGRSGEGYVLSGHAMTVIDLLHELARLSGIPAPRLRFPVRVARAVGLVAPAYYRVRRQRPLFTTYSVDVINSNYCMDNSKAVRELGFAARPLTETFADTIRWFRREGML